MPYRLIYIGLALVGLAAIALGVVLSREGEAVELPGPVESVSPRPGDLVPLQTTVEIDLEVGYAAEIFVDGWPVTDASFEQATGVYRWSPGPSHPSIQEWAPGEHTIRIVYDTYTGLPDRGNFQWTFRVG